VVAWRSDHAQRTAIRLAAAVGVIAAANLRAFGGRTPARPAAGAICAQTGFRRRSGSADSFFQYRRSSPVFTQQTLVFDNGPVPD
jgi:hypothetical protein